jgi:hypothetical protein
MHHRRNLLGLREHLLEAEGVAVPVVTRDVAILAPRVRDVEVVAHECEAARDVQRLCGRRWIEEQRMHLTRGAVVLEDADVVDAVPRFTPIADPPHDSVLPNTIVASSESARDAHRADDRSHTIRCPEIYRPFGSAAPTWIRVYCHLLQPESLVV